MERLTDKQLCIIIVTVLIIGWGVAMLVNSLSPSLKFPGTIGEIGDEYICAVGRSGDQNSG